MRTDPTDSKYRNSTDQRNKDEDPRESRETRPWQHRVNRFLDCERRSFARMLGLPAPRPCANEKDMIGRQ